MRILLTGADGQVGWELRRTLLPLGQVAALNRSLMDLSDPDSIAAALTEVKPDLIVNAAAYTAVDKAESDRDAAMAINGVAPGILAEAAKRSGALLVHYSTDYVFDGTKSDPYVEDDPTNPLNVYGASKLAGETAIRQTGGRHLIFRTSWVYGVRGKNFLLTMRRLAKERDELRIVSDQYGAPTWSRWIAEMTAQILAGCRRSSWDEVSGTYHMSAAGVASWFAFAQAILRDTPSSTARLLPIPAAEYGAAAPRPRNSVLSNAKLEKVFGLDRADWPTQLALCMAELPRT